MTLRVTHGGLLVALSMVGVILYEIRTLLDFVGVSIPIVPYLVGTVLVTAIILLYVSLTDGWKNDSSPVDNR